MTFFEWVQFWIDWLLDQIPLVWARLTETWNELVLFIITTGNNFILWWNDTVDHVTAQATIIFGHITTVKDAIYAYFVVVWDALISAIGTAVHNAKVTLNSKIANLRLTIVSWLDTVYAYIATQINIVISSLTTSINNVIASLQTWVNGLLTPINQLTTYLFNGVTILIDRPVFFFTELLRMFFLTFILEEIGHALGAENATLPPKTNWWNF